MMTMATSTVNRTTSWCSPSSLTFSGPFLCSSVSPPSKFEAYDEQRQSFCNLSILHEIPTREFRRDLPDAVIDNLDDGVDVRHAIQTLPSTTLEENAATFSYQSELAAITAAIDRMRQRDAELATPPPSTTTPPPEIPTPPPAPSADVVMMDNDTPTATPLSTPTATPITPDPIIVVAPDDDDSTHPHDARCASSSITATFLAQAQMLRTINMLLVDLAGLVDKLVDDPTRCDTRPPSSLYDMLQSTPYPSICLIPAIRPSASFPNSQLQPWPLRTAESGTLPAPVPKISPYKKRIPAKPPFPRNRSRDRTSAMPRTKDRLRPPK